jgi:hypothetical protein
MKKIYYCMIFLSFWSTCIQAQGDGDMWAFVVIPMCLSQDTAYASSNVGHAFLRGGSVDSFVKTPVGMCFKKHNWAPKKLCDDLMNLRDDEWKDMEHLYQRHKSEIKGMKVAFDYYNDILLTPIDHAQPECP